MRMAFACVDRLRMKWSEAKKVMSRRIKIPQKRDCHMLLWKSTTRVLQNTQSMTVSSDNFGKHCAVL